MLTLKQITEQTDIVLEGLEKRHFNNAKELVGKVVELNDIRKNHRHSLTEILPRVRNLQQA